MDVNPNPDLNTNTNILSPVVNFILKTLQEMQQEIDRLQNNNQSYDDHAESQPPSHEPTHYSSHPNHTQPTTIHHPGHLFTEFIMSESIPSSY